METAYKREQYSNDIVPSSLYSVEWYVPEIAAALDVKIISGVLSLYHDFNISDNSCEFNNWNTGAKNSLLGIPNMYNARFEGDYNLLSAAEKQLVSFCSEIQNTIAIHIYNELNQNRIRIVAKNISTKLVKEYMKKYYDTISVYHDFYCDFLVLGPDEIDVIALPNKNVSIFFEE